MNDDQTTPAQPTTMPQADPVRVAPEPAAPPTPAPMVTPPPPAPAPQKKPALQLKDPRVIIAIVLGAGILLFGFLYVRSTMQPAEAPAPQVTPTVQPTPTPPLHLSGIASTSAFFKYSEDVASFSAILNAFNLQDATLAPPILDTEIDLSE